MVDKDYYIGLDIGTNTIGWAVTDEKYNLMRAKGKDLWGVRFFQEAQTAADRRVHRSNRRRLMRRNSRLQILREIFEDEISKVDPKFYERMDESKYWVEDKKVSGKYSLFNDKNYTDTDYFKEYPTIFHLRKSLIKHEEKADIRLYFLAINQIMKRRGHFLIDGKLNNVTDIEPIKLQFIRILNDKYIEELDESFIDEAFEIISDINEKKTNKKNQIKELLNRYNFSKDENKILKNIFELIISGKGKVKNIIDDENIIEKLKEDKKEDFLLTGESYEENLSYFESILGEDILLFTTIKSVYDFTLLQDILRGNDFLSYAQVERYNEHKKYLEKLKSVIKKYDNTKESKLYNKIFKSINNPKGYVAYLGYHEKNGKKTKVKKITNQEFTDYIKKILNEKTDLNDSDVKDILNKIEKDEFLLKQISSKNSVIPYQIHQFELERILDNLVKDYPSFNEIEEGFTKRDKISKTFSFRIPYYVGPLNDYHKNNGGNAWIFRDNDRRVKPWNFEQVVDLHKSEDEFIRRMLNKCTYLPSETVLPKASLLYSEYMVLNELNKLKIGDSYLSVDLKADILENLYRKDPRVNLKKIRDYLIRTNKAEPSDFQKGETNQEIKSNLKSYIDFTNILEEKFDYEMVEDLIEKITIHTGNKKLLTKYIKETYSNLTDYEIKEITSLKYKDWGRLSRKLLVGIKETNLKTNRQDSIINFMRLTNDNFTQIVEGPNYTFKDYIEKIRLSELSDNLGYDVIDSLYVSPSVKKMIWQVLKLTEEIVKVKGYRPKKIFIEMARSNEEKKKTVSRKNRLLELYKAIRNDKESLITDYEYDKLIKGIKDTEESDFRSKVLFLYYSQLGKDMYTGENIDLNHMFDKTMYDIDHIIPRRMKKDDSITTNLVLVNKKSNQDQKKDIYPVPSTIRNNPKVYNLWKLLVDKEFITKEKYNRLVRKDELTNEELAGFISRQLVETRQSTKVVKELFEKYYPDLKIVTVKAGLVSELRHDFKVLKSREANDLHHAHDAFLNIIAGDVWNRKYTSNPLNFVKENRKSKQVNYSLNHIFEKSQKVRNKVIWEPDKGKELIIKTLNKPSVLTSSEAFEQKGALYNATIIGKKDFKKNTKYLPLKKDERLSDISKYGGYSSLTGAYFYLVEHTVKGKRIKTIEFVPLHLSSEIKSDKDKLLKYSTDELGLINPEIIIKKIKFKTEIEVDGFRYLISGRTGNRISLEPNMQCFWKIEELNILKTLQNKYEKGMFSDIDKIKDEDIFNMKLILNKLMQKLSSSPYINRINMPIIDKSKIDDVKVTELFIIIKNLLILLNKTVMTSDLSLIGLAKKSGKTLLSNNIEKYNSFVIIHKSISGLYERKIRII